jgi:hypothetical protein
MTLRALVPAVFLALAVPLLAEDSDGFVPLFNGRNLDGWVRVNCAVDTFTVRDGMIIDTGVPTGVMRTARMYENFILEFDWRHLKSGGNSGCFTWGDGLPASGGPFPRGIEVQVLDPGYGQLHKGENEWFTCNGDLFPVRGATMTPFGRISKTGQRSFPIEDRTNPSPEWNHYRLVANAGELRLSVNGKEVTVGKDCVPRKGFLNLEAEGSEVHFRNLRIKELATTNTPPEQTANPYEGFKPIFSGKGFEGWKTDDAIKAAWTARGAQFTSTGTTKGPSLDTEKHYRDFTLCVDWRLAKKTPASVESGIRLRGCVVKIGATSGGIAGHDEIASKAKADEPFGKANRFFITLKGDRVTVVLNDQTLIDQAPVADLPSEGPISLLHPGGEIEFSNLFVREL